MKNIALNSVADALSSGTGGSFARDDDPALVADAVPFALKTMESLAEKLPDHAGLRRSLAAGFTQYGYAFVQQEADEIEAKDQAGAKARRARAGRLYLRARNYGLEGLHIAKQITVEQLRGPEAGRDEALARLTKEDVPLLYWTLVPWAAAIALNKRDLELVGDVPFVAAMLDRALVLDEAWDLGALHEFSLAFDSARPDGTTPEAQKKHFERARELGKGKKISALVSQAESVAGPAQDKSSFEALLKEALAFDADAPDARDWRLANLIAQRRARYLLEHEEDIIAENRDSRPAVLQARNERTP